MTFVDLLHCPVRARWPFVRVLALLIPLLVASESSLAGNVNLAWDPVATATGYRLHYGTSSGNYSSSVDAKNQTTITVFGLTDGTTFFFAVTAYNSATTSGFSNEVTAVPASSPSPFPDTTPPAQPKNLRIAVQ
jgi:Fibronectin type III domain